MELLAQDMVRNGNQYEDRTDGTDQLLFTHLLPLVIRRILQKKICGAGYMLSGARRMFLLLPEIYTKTYSSSRYNEIF